MTDMMRRRVDRAIAALSQKQKAELLDAHIGPMLPGSTPNPEADARYLRDIVESQLREQDERKANGLAKLERRIDKLERQLRAMPGAIGAAIFDAIDAELERRCLLEYKGIWDEALTYKCGSAVAAGNSVWVAVAPAGKGERPGKSRAWRLAAKAPSPAMNGAGARQ
jgi:hypothetical protein